MDFLSIILAWLFISSPFIVTGIVVYFVSTSKLKSKIFILEGENKGLRDEILQLNDKIKNISQNSDSIQDVINNTLNNEAIHEVANTSKDWQEPTMSEKTDVNIADDKQSMNCTKFNPYADSYILLDKVKKSINNYYFETNDFIEIEINKRITDLNPKVENFVLNDEKLIDDIVSFIIEDKTTNRLSSKFNIPYNRVQTILRDLKILKLIKENPNGAYGDVPVFSNYFYYDIFYKRKYSDFKLKITEHIDEIEYKVNEELQSIKEQNDRWEVLEKERKKEEIRLKLLKQQEQKELQKKVKQEMMEEGLIPKISTKKRENISQEVKDAVWNRDGGKCVECGSNEKLEYDHIIPISKGGSNTIRNLQLLCETCNRQKSNKIGQ